MPEFDDIITDHQAHKTLIAIDGLPHIPQNSSWDCGLACFRMSLRFLRPDITEHDILTACEKHNLVQSVWTIDLAYLCSILGIPHLFCTQTIGVDKGYKNESFYQNEMQANFTEEELRVNKLFAEASGNRVNIKKCSVKLEEIIDRLRKGQPAIVLIDDTERSRQRVDENITATAKESVWRSCWNCLCCVRRHREYADIGEHSQIVVPAGNSTGFWGHFVVIVGCDLSKKVFILNDPSPGGRHVQCSFGTFERARKSFGTDEDILFLFSSGG